MRSNSAIYAKIEIARGSAKRMEFPTLPENSPARASANANTFLMDDADLQDLACDSWRRKLLHRLSEMLPDLRQPDARPIPALVGGSFLHSARRPRGLGYVVFYTGGRGLQAGGLASQIRWSARLVDPRLTPHDRDPIISPKVSVYLEALCAATKYPSALKNAAPPLDHRSEMK